MSNKAISGVLAAALMATVVLGVWFVSDPVYGATYEETTKTANATINTNVSCGFSADFADYVGFGAADPGSSNQVEDSNGFNATAGATNNVNITFWIMANDDLDKQGSTPNWLIGNMTWSDNSTYDDYTVDETTMTKTAYDEFNHMPTGGVGGIPASGEHYFQVYLDYPSIEAGTYNNTLYVKCNESS